MRGFGGRGGGSLIFRLDRSWWLSERERKREFETRETKSLRGEKRKSLRREKVIEGI